jgi:hypothetical protein
MPQRGAAHVSLSLIRTVRPNRAVEEETESTAMTAETVTAVRTAAGPDPQATTARRAATMVTTTATRPAVTIAPESVRRGTLEAGAAMIEALGIEVIEAIEAIEVEVADVTGTATDLHAETVTCLRTDAAAEVNAEAGTVTVMGDSGDRTGQRATPRRQRSANQPQISQMWCPSSTDSAV